MSHVAHRQPGNNEANNDASHSHADAHMHTLRHAHTTHDTRHTTHTGASLLTHVEKVMGTFQTFHGKAAQLKSDITELNGR